jgi:hypothetical protein
MGEHRCVFQRPVKMVMVDMRIVCCTSSFPLTSADRGLQRDSATFLIITTKQGRHGTNTTDSLLLPSLQQSKYY